MVTTPHSHVTDCKFKSRWNLRVFCGLRPGDIAGEGVLRTRYPIMPVDEEGAPVWKELEALRDVVMDMRYVTWSWTSAA